MRVSEKRRSRKLESACLQGFEANGSLLPHFVATSVYQAVLRQSSKGRLQR